MGIERTVRISCVVVAYHRPAALDALLEAIGAAHERIVVNVEADPAVASVAARWGAIEVPLPGNPGFGAGVNAGVRVSSGDLVAFMNDDIVVSGAALSTLAERLAEHRASVIVPRLSTPMGEVERTVMALPTAGRILLEWALLPDRPVRWLRTLHVEKWREPATVEVVRATTAAIVLATGDLLTRCPLPEGYFLYWEEAEWFWRLAETATRVVIDPSVTVVHMGGRDDVRPEKSRLLARNAVRCVRRTQGSRAAAWAWGAVLIWNIRLVLVALLRRLIRGRGEEPTLHARLAGLGAAVEARREIGREPGVTI